MKSFPFFYGGIFKVLKGQELNFLPFLSVKHVSNKNLKTVFNIFSDFLTDMVVLKHITLVCEKDESQTIGFHLFLFFRSNMFQIKV
ncbi:hypothetical protein CRV01_03700 [Arcobacter sp. CECT 8983]|nr:hypothetical protein CRV01_03700 [Arcobacter sp. CECT 8983]